MSQLEGPARADERRAIEEALASVRLPKEIRKVAFELGNDSTGNEAVTIWITVPTNDNPSKKTVALLRRVAEALRNAVFATGTDRFPYVRFKAAR